MGALPDFQPIILSVPTAGGGATPSATFMFASIGYKSPRQPRMSSSDTVSNQNEITRHIYDNGPGPYQFPQFQIGIHAEFEQALGDVATQWANLRYLWQYKNGPMGMETPDGVYSVVWSDGTTLEPDFLRFPIGAGDKLDLRVVVSFDEA